MFLLLAQETKQLAVDAAVAPVAATSGWLIFWLIFAVIFLPYILGSIIAKTFRLKEFSSRMGTVIFCVSLAIVPMCFQLAQGKSLGDCFRLGIDLAGGTNLVYRVDLDKADDSGKDIDRSLDNMVGAIARRINPSGTEEVTVRRVGSDRIEIIIPGADQAYVDEMKDRITRLGTLRFEILATPNNAEHRAFIKRANELAEDVNPVTENGRTVARWVDVAPNETVGRGGNDLLPSVHRTRKGKDDVEIEQVLVVVSSEEREVTGEFLVRAQEQMDQSGQLVVGFRFDQTGANRFLDMTSAHKPLKDGKRYRLAILLDDKIQSAPSLNEAIGAQGQISGNFTRAEIRSLTSILNAGALDVPLITDPISEFTISPLLGVDIRNKGIFAIELSCVVVIGFMAIYYLKAGLIAVLCLLLNILLIMGTMIFVQGTFTLPGLAGLVLTIGMAVDANVLIFERIREELSRGASVRMAIHNGFDKAFTAIIDSNLTTLIVAIVLFMIGTDQVKGFAVTLFIGIVMSMFSALYFGRMVFEILEQKRVLKKLPMMSLVKSPNLDFIGKRKLAMSCSAVVIAVGLAAFASRGVDNLDIDFRGGTMVTFEFQQAQKLSDFRSNLETEFDSSITVERLTLEDETQEADSGRRWRLRTTIEEAATVEAGVAKALGQMGLRKVTVSNSELIEIATATTGTGDDATPEKSAYEGGLETTLEFSDEITITAVARNLRAAISGLPNGSSYTNPEDLFRMTGVKGSGVVSKEGQVRKFSEVKLEVSKDLKGEDLKAALTAMQDGMNNSPLFEEVSKFAKSVGGEMQNQAITAMMISLGAIVIYVWFRFQRVTFGIAAVAALVHDVLVVLGVVALASLMSGNAIGSLFDLYDFKINLPMIAAFLTIVGYSLNDTIVVFDRVREVRGKNPNLTPEMINTSLNQTLSRTLLTSLTTFFVVAILYLFGGEGIHGFAFCLLVGVIVGTYSSIYVASPVLLWLMNREEKTAKAA
ncbi:MAG: protein translocase subunit SecD [Planctomycetota bacterium]|nr:protein translocase subunit SecD [Planctomycetota bacterium]